MIDLIIQSPVSETTSKSVKKSKSGFVEKLKAEGINLRVEELYQQPKKVPKSKSFKAPAQKEKTVQHLIAKTGVSQSEMNPWDMAHLVNRNIASSQSFVEPDALNEFIVDAKVRTDFKNIQKSLLKKSPDVGSHDPDWDPQKDEIWHLNDPFSQLKSARDAVANLDNYEVRIAHFDTGYSDHPAMPAKLDKKLQRNFVEGEEVNNAKDRNITGTLKMPGHGTGTICILAGNKVLIPSAGFNDFLGGAPFATVIPCRISNTVVLMKTSSFAKALQYLVDLSKSGTQVHVLSMSMGGVPSQLWADAVNAAYEAGITLVTAAGNNFNGLPTRKLIYPARFNRVIAACGATFDYAPYFHKKLGEMQGNWGPQKNMSKALAAFTPNTPWAVINSPRISFGGAGTSSATPQVAAAAACYYKKYHNDLDKLEPWMRVEAIRNALYSTALKKVEKASEPFNVYFGNGILQTKAALNIPVKKQGLTKSPVDDVPFLPILATLFKSKEASPIDKNELKMFNVELAQLVFEDASLRKILHDEEKNFEELTTKEKSKFLDNVLMKNEASKTLRQFIKENHKRLSI